MFFDTLSKKKKKLKFTPFYDFFISQSDKDLDHQSKETLLKKHLKISFISNFIELLHLSYLPQSQKSLKYRSFPQRKYAPSPLECSSVLSCLLMSGVFMNLSIT